MVERLVLEVGQVELVGDQTRGDVMRRAPACPLTGGSARGPPPSSAGAYDVADAERELRVVIEEERRDVVVEDR